MALWECGFEVGDLTYYLEQGWTTSGSTAITTTAGRYHTSLSSNGGAQALQIDDQTRSPVFSFTNGRWLHFWLHPISNNASKAIVQFWRAGSIQASVNFYASGLVLLRRGEEGVTGTTVASGGWDQNRNHWIAIEADLKDSGTLAVWIDGVQAATFSGDVQYLSTADWDQFSFYAFNQAIAVDDIVITDSTEGRLGEHFIAGLEPNADDVTALTPSTGTLNYALVDEIPQSTTDYNEATATLQQDTYDTTNLGWTPDSIHCVGLWAYATRDGAITDAKLVVKSGTTTDLSSAIALPAAGSYGVITNIWNDDPDTSSAWSAAGVNAMKIGIQFV